MSVKHHLLGQQRRRRLRSLYDGKAPQNKLDQLEEDLIPPAAAKVEKK